MRNIYLTLLLMAAFSGGFASADVRGFRIDQDRLWLRADQEPLVQVMKYFAAAGVNVQIDPEAQGLVSGDWNGADAENALKQMIFPCDYLLDWSRDSGPLGDRITLTGIRVFRKGFAAAARPLCSVRRVTTTLDGRARFLAREILIGFSPGASMNDLRLFLARTGGTVIKANVDLGIYRILLPEGTNIPDLASQLVNDPQIALAEPNYVYDLPAPLSGTDAASGAPKQWTPPASDGPVAVSVLDSGLVYNDGLSTAVLSAFDATHPDAPLNADAVGHGTLMAKLAAGLVDPYNTAVGEGVPVVAVKAFADDGSADAFTLMNAMTYAVANSSGPISLSWGSETPSKLIENAVNYAIHHGSPVFAAVGNKNTGEPMYPAACPGVVGVAAGTVDGGYTDYSNQGDFVDIVIPGSAGGSDGTSISAAAASHITGLYMQIHPDISGREAAQALLDAAGSDKFLSYDERQHYLSR